MRDGRGSVVFDRAAATYDRTRALPPAAMAELVAVLDGALTGPCLEIGVGTGRVALPLAAAGVEVVGCDLSAPMLDVLVTKAGGRIPFALARADATRLPFGAGTFASALSMHVLHLVSDWRRAVAELVRVLRPGAVVVHGWTRWPGPVGEIAERFAAEAGLERVYPGLLDERVLDGEFARYGATPRELPTIPFHEDVSPEDLIRRLEDGVHSWTWQVTADDRRRVADVVRSWATERFGSLDVRRPELGTVRLRAYYLPTSSDATQRPDVSQRHSTNGYGLPRVE